ncbi:MAG: hypothetical protein V4696_10180 [Pseudomonadota bacterium]
MADDIGSARNAVAITPHDTTPLATPCRAIYVGGAGNITLRPRGSSADVVLTAVPAGTIFPIEATHVRATGTAATALVALN